MDSSEFMMYSYKTSFCPYISKKHEWHECNYAHKQQDFRRPPHQFFYSMQKCEYVQEGGNWDNCPDYIDCPHAHTLIEQLYSPLNYKMKQCPDHQPENKFLCKRRPELCCHSHSKDEKNAAIEALRITPAILTDVECIQQYRDYIQTESFLDEDDETIEKKVIKKKMTLAKLPEDNPNKWRELEEKMNMHSIQKSDSIFSFDYSDIPEHLQSDFVILKQRNKELEDTN